MGVQDCTTVHFGDRKYNTTIWGLKFVPFWFLGVGDGLLLHFDF